MGIALNMPYNEEVENMGNGGQRANTASDRAKRRKTPSGPPPIDAETYNPVAQYRQHARDGEGAQAFRDELNSLSEEQLHQIIRKNHLDRAGRTKRWKKDRLVNFTFDISQSRATQGDVFYHYQG